MSGFWRYAARRMLASIPVLIGVSFIVFFSIRLIPGDPARLMAGEDALLEDIERLRVRYGLDKPLIVQYGNFILRMIKGDLGTSLRTDSAIADELKHRYSNTIVLASFAMFLAISISVPIGIISAIRRGALSERFVFIASLIGITAPSFWIALILQLVFSVKLHLLPTIGAGSFRELILPAITIAAYPTASLARQSRAAMLDVLSEDYVRTARAKGVHPFGVYFRHALKNALIPVVTLAGYQFARALGGAIIAETVFAYPGVGRYLILSISVRDYPAIQVTVMVIALTYVFLTLITDLSYSFLDPRISYD